MCDKYDFKFVDYVLKHNGKNIQLPYDNGTHAETNPSILINNDSLFINFRCVDYFLFNTYGNDYYSINDFGWIVLKDLYSCNTKNTFKMFDKDFKCIGIKKDVLGDDFNDGKIQNSLFHGLEDVRLVKWDDKIYLIGNRPDISNHNRMSIYCADDSYNITKEILIDEVENAFVEKNWSPVEGKPFTFIRWTNPTEIIKVDENGKIVSREFKENHNFPTNFRGGSQTIKTKYGYMSIIHTSNLNVMENAKTNIRYRHFFIMYDDDFNIIKISDPFVFQTPDVEFCCGLCKDSNDDIYITYSIKDSTAFLIKTTLDDVLNYIDNGNVGECNYVDDFDYLGFADNCLANKNYYPAISMYNKVFTNDMIDKDIQYQSLCKSIISMIEINKISLENNYDKELYKNVTINELIHRLILLNVNYADGYLLKAHMCFSNNETTSGILFANLAKGKILITKEFTKYISLNQFRCVFK